MYIYQPFIPDVRQRFYTILRCRYIHRNLQPDNTHGSGVDVEWHVLSFRHINGTKSRLQGILRYQERLVDSEIELSKLKGSISEHAS